VYTLQLVALLITLICIYCTAIFIHTYRIKLTPDIISSVGTTDANSSDTSGSNNSNADDIADAVLVQDDTIPCTTDAASADRKVSNCQYLN
jgi:hypothetical protein